LRMPRLAAAIFDLGNTLVKTPYHTVPIEEGSSVEIARFESTVKATYDSLMNSGIKMDWSSFYEKYRIVRAEQLHTQKQTLREYDMGDRVARTLSALGFRVSANSETVKKAIDCHFHSYESYVETNSETESVLQYLCPRYKLGLITNFAHPPTIHNLLDKFRLRRFFDVITISGEFGWVKPSPRIFQSALSALKLKAEKCVFIGDDLEADIKGANGIGMKTVLLTEKNLSRSGADSIIHNLRELPSTLDEIEGRDGP